MSAVLEPKAWTIEEFLALPDDGVERWLINGQLREARDPEMTRRNRRHSQVLIALATLLKNWRNQIPEPRGQVLGGEVGCILSQNPQTIVGIDVAYFSHAAMVAETDDNTTLVGRPPVLAAEILSPSDTVQNINEKIRSYLTSGVKLVWIIDPDLKSVVVHRPDAPPELFNCTQTLTAEPHLPGFSAAVKEIFE